MNTCTHQSLHIQLQILLLHRIFLFLYLLWTTVIPVLLNVMLVLFPCLEPMEAQGQFLLNDLGKGWKWSGEEGGKERALPTQLVLSWLFCHFLAIQKQDSSSPGEKSVQMDFILNY